MWWWVILWWACKMLFPTSRVALNLKYTVLINENWIVNKTTTTKKDPRSPLWRSWHQWMLAAVISSSITKFTFVVWILDGLNNCCEVFTFLSPSSCQELLVQHWFMENDVPISLSCAVWSCLLVNISTVTCWTEMETGPHRDANKTLCLVWQRSDWSSEVSPLLPTVVIHLHNNTSNQAVCRHFALSFVCMNSDTTNLDEACRNAAPRGSDEALITADLFVLYLF